MNRTPLYENHKESGAKMVNFGGWEMPLVFSSINDEHRAVRNDVGIFDVSHMGEIYLEGEGALEFISEHCTSNILKCKSGQLKYAHILNEEGGIIDDTIVTRLSKDSCYIVPNAGKTDRVYEWLSSRGGDEYMTDITQDTVMIAIQGPKAVDLVNDISDQDVSELKFFNSRNIEINKDIMDVFEEDWILSETPIIQRSGYTGEDGFEVVLPPRSGNELWKSLLKNDISPLPCGLGARDTLRLEFGFLLSGQDFDESRTTIETGWEDKCVDWKHDFVGKDRLEEMKESDHQTLRGILMVDKGIPRNGHKVYADDEMIGMVTSGTRSISLRCGIGLAYLDPGYLEEGTEITLDIRGKMRKAVVKTPPFV